MIVSSQLNRLYITNKLDHWSMSNTVVPASQQRTNLQKCTNTPLTRATFNYIQANFSQKIKLNMSLRGLSNLSKYWKTIEGSEQVLSCIVLTSNYRKVKFEQKKGEAVLPPLGGLRRKLLMNQKLQKLSKTDLYAIRRIMLQMEPVEGLIVDPMVAMLQETIKTSEQISFLSSIIDKETYKEILTIDPDILPDSAKPKNGINPYPIWEGEQVIVPELPPEAQLTDEAKKAGESVSPWLGEAMGWLNSHSPMTPDIFFESALQWLIGLVIARRLSLGMGFDTIYPNLFVLWIARTSVYSKSTGLKLIGKMVEATVPHLRLPENNTPEALLHQWGGHKPLNYEELPLHEREIIDEALRFAAQRGFIIDEASILFTIREYLKTLMELLMLGYDCTEIIRRFLRTSGLSVIRYNYTSFLGASTPASMAAVISNRVYNDGTWGRVIVVTPEGLPKYVLPTGEIVMALPTDLVERLKKLYNLLPLPPTPSELKEAKNIQWNAISMRFASHDVFEVWQSYDKAIRFDLLLPQFNVDSRIQGNYSRLPVAALKMAMQAAAIDWADKDGKGQPTIELGHIVRAIQLTERFRASVHRALFSMNKNEDAEAELRVRQLLSQYPEGMTLTDLNNRVGAKQRRTVREALEAMVEGGQIAISKRGAGPQGGRPAKVYSLATD